MEKKKSAAFCVIQQMSIKPLNPSTQIINPFLNSIISANHEKGEEIKPCCFSFVESLFLGYTYTIDR